MRIHFDYYILCSANSCKKATILFHLICLLIITGFPSVISELRSYTCNNASTYADGSIFSSNLNRVMGDLVMNAPQTGFNTSSYGQSPNRIYGLLQCTGNISKQDCSICSQQANDSVLQFCGDGIGDQVWMDNCFLRYENFNFISKLETRGKVLVNEIDISTSNLKVFRNTTLNLLSDLSDKAYKSANKGFAEGLAPYSSKFGTVYGLVQCWRDISIPDCKTCLKLATNNVYECCSMKQGSQALLGSCMVRYEIYPFFGSDTGGSSTSPPRTVAAQIPPANGTSSNLSVLAFSFMMFPFLAYTI